VSFNHEAPTPDDANVFAAGNRSAPDEACDDCKTLAAALADSTDHSRITALAVLLDWLGDGYHPEVAATYIGMTAAVLTDSPSDVVAIRNATATLATAIASGAAMLVGAGRIADSERFLELYGTPWDVLRTIADEIEQADANQVNADGPSWDDAAEALAVQGGVRAMLLTESEIEGLPEIEIADD
jgi:hypothetical protein